MLFKRGPALPPVYQGLHEDQGAAVAGFLQKVSLHNDRVLVGTLIEVRKDQSGKCNLLDGGDLIVRISFVP